MISAWRARFMASVRFEIDGQEALQNLLRLGLEDEVASERVPVVLLLVRLQQILGEREHVLNRDALDERRLEVVVDHDYPIHLGVRVQLGNPVCDRLCVRITGLVREPGELGRELEPTEPERADAPAAHANPADPLTFAAQLPVECERAPQDLRVERARKAPVARQRHDRDVLLAFVLLQQRQSSDGRARPGRAGHQLQHPVGVWPHRLDPRLCLPQLRGGDELHRAGDLPRVANGADPALDVLDGGHG